MTFIVINLYPKTDSNMQQPSPKSSLSRDTEGSENMTKPRVGRHLGRDKFSASSKKIEEM